MAENENVWTQEITDAKLAELLNKAATTGHPEWDYHARYGLANGSMDEGSAISYLEECFAGKHTVSGGSDIDKEWMRSQGMLPQEEGEEGESKQEEQQSEGGDEPKTQRKATAKG
jgi:hypothetical protein